MERQWISAPHERPRCKATDKEGRRCCEPVVWEDGSNRPVATHCQAHGGLADAAPMSWRSPDLKEMPETIGPLTGAVNVLATSVQKMRTLRLGGSLGSLPAMALAAALFLSMAGPVLADFESAVAAYERGAYQEAQTEFAALAAVGDRRAVRYLQKIRQKRILEEQADESFMSSLTNAVSSIFGESNTSGGDSASKRATTKTASSTAGRSTESAWGQKPAVWEPWMPSAQSAEAEPSAPPPDSDVIVPYRESIWSGIFHLPGDATAIGLQYVARFLSAETFSRELQSISRHSEKITLSILAGFWWLVIVRGVVGIGMGISRFMKAATTIREPKHYG